MDIQYNDIRRCPVSFDSYYKDTFTFKGQTPTGQEICAERWDDIYRFKVSNDEVHLEDIQPDLIRVNGKEVEVD